MRKLNVWMISLLLLTGGTWALADQDRREDRRDERGSIR